MPAWTRRDHDHHKAKGLEFDTVIVPGLDRPPRSGEAVVRMALSPLSTCRERGGERGCCLAPIDETGGDKEPLSAMCGTWTKKRKTSRRPLAVCGSDAREVAAAFAGVPEGG